LIALLKTVLIGFGLCFALPMKAAKALRPMPHFWWLLLANIGLSVLLQRWQLRSQPVIYSASGLLTDAFLALLLLGAATWVLSLIKKQVLAFSLATLLLAGQLLLGVIWFAANEWAATSSHYARIGALLLALYAIWWIIIASQGLRVLRLALGGLKTALMAVLLGMLTLWPILGPLKIDFPRYVILNDAELYAEENTLAQPAAAFDAEAVIYAQRNMLEQALSKIRPGTPETPELFVITLAGDAEEDTFLNEAVYTQALFERRFGARQRALVLANHARTTTRYPLATLTNLRAALKGMAAKMNLQEDLLLLFMTSHGSETHEFALQLAPLPLNQITPLRLGSALEDAGITRRILVVSACYSGGYIDALTGDSTVVMTAARADRTSFGCGGDFDMTYFGRAYLLEGLNQHKDLLKAFQSAEISIAERETQQNYPPSQPQIRIGKNAPAMLAQWKRSFIAGDPVPFFAAEQTSVR
jgi:hypothetical protein